MESQMAFALAMERAGLPREGPARVVVPPPRW
jgi:hypothetical protein